MARKPERVTVEVATSIANEMRTFTINVTAPNADFLLADLLRERGVIASPDSDLKHGVKAAIETYLSNTETLISALGKNQKAAPLSRRHARRNRGDSSSNNASSRASFRQTNELRQPATDTAGVSN
jgi:hypothetical protein